jgi:HlyD family secretion protein
MLLLEQRNGKTTKTQARNMNWYLRLGMIGSAVFVGGTMTWATVAPLEGAVIASGVVAVENNISKVQHPTGGVVGTVYVREGQRVSAGDVLVRLDETVTRSSRQIVANELVAMRARLARLTAEMQRAETLIMPADLTKSAASDPDVRQALESESSLFDARAKTRAGQREQLREQIKQSLEEIVGVEAQYEAAKQQTEVAELELADMRSLLARNLVQRPRVTQLQREVSRIRGLMGEQIARVAQVRAKMSETQLQILQIDRTLESEAARERREIETKVTELNEKLAAANDQLQRIDLRAPTEGIVHQLQVNTPGGVIAAGAIVMSIVPERETLVIDAKIAQIDIDQIFANQSGRVRFAAFNNRTTPELQGTVFRIAADLTRDERSGLSFYSVGVRVSDEERARLGSLKLIPGMPADVYLKTTDRTVASFLLKPLLEHMNKAFRED